MLRLCSMRNARAQLTQAHVRLCSTVVVEKSKESLEAISRRKAFRAIDLDMKIMDRLDTMNVGFLPKRKSRVAVAQKFDPTSARFKKEERIEEEKRIPFPFRGTGRLLNNATTKEEIPHIKGSPPEIALIGRSNVGKSTLVNTLLSFDSSYVQKAAVSDKPGETTHLTFYQIGSSYKPPAKMAATPADPAYADEPEKMFKTPALVLTDMPGYGFAFMSEAEKMRCHMLCLDYLVSNIERNRVLKRVILLLDGRHGLKASDIMFLQDLQRHLIEKVVALGGPDSRELMNILPTPAVAPASDVDANTVMPPSITLSNKATKLLSRHLGWKLQLVLTKCDLVDRPELCRRITDVSRTLSEKLPALYHSMLPTLALSAMEKKGVAEMQRDIAALVPPRWEEDPDIKKFDQVTGARVPKKVAEPVHNHNRAKHTIPSSGESKLGRFGIFEKSHEAKKTDSDRPSFAERRLQRAEESRQKATLALSATGVDGPDQRRLSFADRVKERRGTLLADKTSSSDRINPKDKKTSAAGSAGNEESAARGRSRRSRHFDDYAEEIDEYFGDADLDDQDELLDSDFEDGDVDDDMDDPDFDGEPDDVGVNWRAAGEQFDDFSDEEEEILREAQLAGETGGYRSKGPSLETMQLVKDRRRALAREAANATKGALVKNQRTVPFSKKGNFPGDIQRTRINGQWRVPKTASNPKGRHRYAKPVGRVDKRGRTEKKDGVPRSSGFNNGAKSAPSKAGGAGAKKAPPKGEKSPRRKYY